jgi:rhodanese-related sulfurtransferase
MKKRIVTSFLTVCLVMFFSSLAMAQNRVPTEKKEQTKLGKYLTAKEAYAMWQKNSRVVKFLDCRTAEEYVFVGHPPMAYNIPFQLWTGNWDEKKEGYVFQENPDFVAEIREKFKIDDIILVICSSGGRSAKAVDKLTEAGFNNVYNIVTGFAGDKVSPPKNEVCSWEILKHCWKDSHAPWSYQLDPKLVYIPLVSRSRQ